MGNKTKSASFRLDRKTIALIIAGVAAILCFVGVFGTMLTSNLVGKLGGEIQKQKVADFNLAWIFKDGWDYIKTTFADGTGAGIQKFGLVLMIISFFAACGGIVFGLAKTLYSFVKNEEINFKFNLIVLLVAAVQYLFMSRYVLAYSSLSSKSGGAIPSTIDTVYLLGWGGILITIGFFLGLAALIINEYESKETYFRKKNVCLNIAAIVAFFVGLYGLTNIGSIGQKVIGETDITTFSLNAFDLISLIEDGGAHGVASYASAKAFAAIGLVFGIISVLAFFTALFTYINGGEKPFEKKIALFSTIGFTATSLIANIFTIVAAYKIVGDAGAGMELSINPGFTSIVSLALGIGLIILVAVAYKEKKYSKVK